MVETQVLGPSPRPAESELRPGRGAVGLLTNRQGGRDGCQTFENQGFKALESKKRIPLKNPCKSIVEKKILFMTQRIS